MASQPAPERRGIVGLFKAILAQWTKDRVPRLAAALSYYTIFAVAPLLVIAVSVAGLVLGQSSTRDQVVGQVLEYTRSAQIARTVETILNDTARPRTGVLATVLGTAILLIGASNIFRELKMALNDMWDVPTRPPRGVLGLIAERAFAVLLVIVAGILLLTSLVLTTWLTAANRWINANWAGSAALTQAFAFLLSFAITFLLFAMIYRFIPDIRIAWRDVWSGAAVTAFLFSVGRLLIALYLGRTTPGSAYGAAGSLVVVLLWMYWSAQIFFFGAEFTQVYARTRGSRQREEEKLDIPEPVPPEPEPPEPEPSAPEPGGEPVKT